MGAGAWVSDPGPPGTACGEHPGRCLVCLVPLLAMWAATPRFPGANTPWTWLAGQMGPKPWRWSEQRSSQGVGHGIDVME